MADPLAISVSVLAFAVSATTAWLTLFRRGTVNMTQPTVMFFGPDTSRHPGDKPLPKVFLRTLLFATSKRGRILESMHVALSRNETHQNFNIWVYGDEKLMRGSGLFIGESGVAANHHFLTPKEEDQFGFRAGQYQIKVFAKLLGDKKQILLFSHSVNISREHATSLEDGKSGLYLDWGPDSSSYIPHLEQRPAILRAADSMETPLAE